MQSQVTNEHNKQELLEIIQLGFVPDTDFFLRIYGFDLSFPGFRDLALNQLNRIGYHDAWKTYAEIVTEYEDQQSAMFKRAAERATQRGGMADGQ